MQLGESFNPIPLYYATLFFLLMVAGSSVLSGVAKQVLKGN